MKTYGTLVKATSPFERINIDFKGPIPSKTRNFYILTIIDEFSRFPFAYACHDMSATRVVNCLKNLFCLFGVPAFVHSDRGASFMSKEVKNFLNENGVATSRTTPYNPQGNGQVERFNGTLWKTINLALKTRGLKTEDWEVVLQESLHAIRSLLCTATNCTPHERFFVHPRRTSNGVTLPSWLTPGPVLAKRNVRHSKYDDNVEEVELLEVNPQYALIRREDGSEATVSLRHLAPKGTPTPNAGDTTEQENPVTSGEALQECNVPETEPPVEELQSTDIEDRAPLDNRIVRSQRIKRPPSYLKDYVMD